MTLNTKIQHKNFEPGEFVEEKKRTFAETIDLINNFPWEKEREQIKISLTNPSVTIESDSNTFLKFALFYNGKFVLHYFNWHQELYTKSFYHKGDAYTHIQKFYESEVFDTTDFKKENTWMQHNLMHFVSQDFHYTITGKRIRDYLLFTSGINFGLSAFIIFALLFSSNIHRHLIPLSLLFLLLTFFIGGGINLILFFNYYSFAKRKILIMSKVNDVFYYCKSNQPEKYDKNDIIQVTTYQGRSDGHNIVSAFAFVKIDFMNNTSIYIPNLFVSEKAIQDKLYKCPQARENSFPMIKGV